MASGGTSLGWIIEAAFAQNKRQDIHETNSLRYKLQVMPKKRVCQPTNDKLANLLSLIPTQPPRDNYSSALVALGCLCRDPYQ